MKNFNHKIYLTSYCTLLEMVLFLHVVQEYMYPYGTIIFTVICGALWTYLYFFLPKTKGRSVEDITAELKAKTGERKAVRQDVNEPEEANGTNSYESPPPGKG